MAATVKAGKPPRAPARPPTRDHLPPAQNGKADATADPGVLRFSAESDEPEEREPLFYINDAEYTIPVEPGPGIGMEALHIIAEGGGSAVAMAMADDYVMTEMLGAEGWEALRGCKTVKRADMLHLIQVCTQKALGALENPNP